MEILFSQLNLAICLLGLVLAAHLSRQRGPAPRARVWAVAALAVLSAHALLLYLAIELGQPSLPAALTPGVAVLFAACLYRVFEVLVRPQADLRGGLLHLIVPAIVSVAMLGQLGLWLVDPLVIVAQLAYALGLARLVAKGAERFGLSDQYNQLALKATVLALGYISLSALGDLFIYLELQAGRSLAASWSLLLSMALKLAALAGFLVLRLENSPLLDWMFAAPRRSAPPSKAEAQTYQRVHEALCAWLSVPDRLADEAVSLRVAARGLGVPARTVSQAVNHVTGESFSRLLNRKRVESAQAMLSETPEKPVTVILYDAGFRTKSSFNREFKSIVGITPSEYRRSLQTAQTARPPGRPAED